MLDVKKNDDSGNIVNDLFFFLPSFGCFFDEHVRSSFRGVLFNVRIHQPSHVDVGHKLPDSVRRNQYELVVCSQRVVEDLRVRHDSDRLSNLVSERPRHGQSGYVFVLHPDSDWPHRLAVEVFEGFDPAALGNDAGVLVLLVGLVVSRQLFDLDARDALRRLRRRVVDHNGPRVSAVRADEPVAFEENHSSRRPAELAVERNVVELDVDGDEGFAQRFICRLRAFWSNSRTARATATWRI